MNPKYFGLNAKIGCVVKAPGDQSRIVAIAAAFAAAAQGTLPSSAVENVTAYYAQSVLPVASMKLSELNESVIFGAKSALEYTLTFWQMRYYAAFPAKFDADYNHRLESFLSRGVSNSLDVSALLCGGSVFISEEMSGFMNKYKKEITTIAASMIAVLADPDTTTVNDTAVLG